jgi:hypothetical protein
MKAKGWGLWSGEPKDYAQREFSLSRGKSLKTCEAQIHQELTGASLVTLSPSQGGVWI